MQTALDPGITMGELLRQFPGAQRALFRKYHIGGCSSCGFSLNETLTGVCARNDNLPVDEVVDHIMSSDAAERAMQIEPAELAQRLKSGESVSLLDIRTREEFEAVNIAGAQFFTQELMQEITSKWPREQLLVVYDHTGERALDAAAWFQGHGFTNVKVLRGGIDAWSAEVDRRLPRYHLERHPEQSEVNSRDRDKEPDRPATASLDSARPTQD
jgi:rhodanese-related sulfurtransferase